MHSLQEIPRKKTPEALSGLRHPIDIGPSAIARINVAQLFPRHIGQSRTHRKQTQRNDNAETAQGN